MINRIFVIYAGIFGHVLLEKVVLSKVGLFLLKMRITHSLIV